MKRERKREKKSEKERKRAKKSERADMADKREKINSFLLCFFRKSFFVLSRLSLSYSLSPSLLKEQTL